jgi:hypothetical protein
VTFSLDFLDEQSYQAANKISILLAPMTEGDIAFLCHGKFG